MSRWCRCLRGVFRSKTFPPPRAAPKLQLWTLERIKNFSQQCMGGHRHHRRSHHCLVMGFRLLQCIEVTPSRRARGYPFQDEPGEACPNQLCNPVGNILPSMFAPWVDRVGYVRVELADLHGAIFVMDPPFFKNGSDVLPGRVLTLALQYLFDRVGAPRARSGSRTHRPHCSKLPSARPVSSFVCCLPQRQIVSKSVSRFSLSFLISARKSVLKSRASASSISASKLTVMQRLAMSVDSERPFPVRIIIAVEQSGTVFDTPRGRTLAGRSVIALSSCAD
jgi:hypothetical protein